MNLSPSELLKSTPDDYDFHTRRTMFWIVNDEIVIAPIGTSMSHLEMAQSLGWVNDLNLEPFFNENPRGFYLSTNTDNRVHFYQGVGFGFDERLKTKILPALPKIRQQLGLSDNTEVYFGPKDSLIKGVNYPIERIGTVSDLT